jgi:hypothetical protein
MLRCGGFIYSLRFFFRCILLLNSWRWGWRMYISNVNEKLYYLANQFMISVAQVFLPTMGMLTISFRVNCIEVQNWHNCCYFHRLLPNPYLFDRVLTANLRGSYSSSITFAMYMHCRTLSAKPTWTCLSLQTHPFISACYLVHATNKTGCSDTTLTKTMKISSCFMLFRWCFLFFLLFAFEKKNPRNDVISTIPQVQPVLFPSFFS